MMPSLDFSIGLEYVLPPLFTASAHCTPFLELCQSSAQNTSLKTIQRDSREGLQGIYQIWVRLLQLHLRQDPGDKGHQSLSVTFNYHLLIHPCVSSETLTLAGCHQSQGEIQQTLLLLEHSSASPEVCVRRELRTPAAQGRIFLGAGREICMWGSFSHISVVRLRSGTLVILGPLWGHLFS